MILGQLQAIQSRATATAKLDEQDATEKKAATSKGKSNEKSAHMNSSQSKTQQYYNPNLVKKIKSFKLQSGVIAGLMGTQSMQTMKPKTMKVKEKEPVKNTHAQRAAMAQRPSQLFMQKSTTNKLNH